MVTGGAARPVRASAFLFNEFIELSIISDQ